MTDLVPLPNNFVFLMASYMLPTLNMVINCSGFSLPPFKLTYEKKSLASKMAIVRLVFLFVTCSC